MLCLFDASAVEKTRSRGCSIETNGSLPASYLPACLSAFQFSRLNRARCFSFFSLSLSPFSPIDCRASVGEACIRVPARAETHHCFAITSKSKSHVWNATLLLISFLSRNTLCKKRDTLCSFMRHSCSLRHTQRGNARIMPVEPNKKVILYRKKITLMQLHTVENYTRKLYRGKIFQGVYSVRPWERD